MAYPGSQLYPLAKSKGWALPDDPGGPGWIGYSQHAYECTPLPTDRISAQEVLDFRDAAFHEYFTHPNYVRMMEAKYGADVVSHLEAMTAYRLPRKHRGAAKKTNIQLAATS